MPRYWLGFMPMADEDLFDIDGQPLGHVTITTRTLGFSLAWKFDLSN